MENLAAGPGGAGVVEWDPRLGSSLQLFSVKHGALDGLKKQLGIPVTPYREAVEPQQGPTDYISMKKRVAALA